MRPLNSARAISTIRALLSMESVTPDTVSALLRQPLVRDEARSTGDTECYVLAIPPTAAASSEPVPEHASAAVSYRPRWSTAHDGWRGAELWRVTRGELWGADLVVDVPSELGVTLPEISAEFPDLERHAHPAGGTSVSPIYYIVRHGARRVALHLSPGLTNALVRLVVTVPLDAPGISP
jgi:hypothetical protein